LDLSRRLSDSQEYDLDFWSETWRYLGLSSEVDLFRTRFFLQIFEPKLGFNEDFFAYILKKLHFQPCHIVKVTTAILEMPGSGFNP
jgi:hypothetical protein